MTSPVLRERRVVLRRLVVADLLEGGHHRLVIDSNAPNSRAIRSHEKVGRHPEPARGMA